VDRIVEFFRLFYPISEEAWRYFANRLHSQYFNIGESIHAPHDISSKLCFIIEGVARSYLQKTDGRDYTWFFHYNNENVTAKQFVLVDYPSFSLQSPSTHGFQALSDCLLFYICHSDLLDVFEKYPEFLAVEKYLVINAYEQNNLLLMSQMSKSAKERLDDFEQEHGMLFDRVPHYHIASYLGITPQRLCQLRRNKANISC
jgi:CRP-like cAMP-binding protein